jgi:hypothetical protein
MMKAYVPMNNDVVCIEISSAKNQTIDIDYESFGELMRKE